MLLLPDTSTLALLTRAHPFIFRAQREVDDLASRYIPKDMHVQSENATVMQASSCELAACTRHRQLLECL